MPRSIASSGLRSNTLVWARQMFWIAVVCGKSSKFWNTMPICDRSHGSFSKGAAGAK